MKEDYISEPYDYSNTPFHIKCDEIIDEISATFRNLGFTEMYLEYRRNKKYTLEEINQYVMDVLINLDELKRHDLNHMWAMLSDKNCWCVEYDIGQIVHDQLMRTWYPDDYK